MKLLITADWQTQLSNLDRCKSAAESVLSLVKEHGLEGVVVAGDLKQAYNPLDLRVINFWTSFVKRIKREGAEPLLLLGNHDRIGLYRDDLNWLPILKDAGASICSEVTPWQFKGGRVHALPFVRDKDDYVSSLQKLHALPTNPKRDILVFHQTIVGAAYHARKTADTGASLKELKPQRYRVCLGGDIHLSQQIGKNAWYVGSPFPMDWGEANQQKVFALLLDNELRFVPTGAASWYDPSVKGFKKPKSWQGARVRLRVPVKPGQDYGALVLQTKVEAERECVGAQITVQPIVQDAADTSIAEVEGSLTERQHMEVYVKKAVKKEDRAETMAYIAHRLAETGIVNRQVGDVTFQRVEARNFLCFSKLEMDLDAPGVTLVTGTNHDRPGKSNGSGKTSLLSALPVALFGKTFKKQDGDAWAKRGTKKTEVSAYFKLAGGGVVQATRKRRPSSVRLYVDGDERSAGGRQANVGKDIEELCGYSWDTFASTVFISQEEIGAFLWGTPKQRHEVIARLQNLERFELAWKKTTTDVSRTIKARELMETDVEEAEEKLRTIEEVSDVTEELARAEKVEATANKKAYRSAAAVPARPSDKGALNTRKLWLEITRQAGDARSSATVIADQIQELRDAPTKCPTCGQTLKLNTAVLRTRVKKLCGALKEARGKQALLEVRTRAAQVKYDHTNAAYRKVCAVRASKQSEARTAESVWKNARTDRRRWEGKATQQRDEVAEWGKTLSFQRATVEVLRNHEQFLYVAAKVLARDGLPAYLSQLLCPKLNAAADYFSDLFTDSEIQVRFSIDNGQVMVDVINPYGGEGIKDQSMGERRIAALITSFALREVSHKSNILILDEPGDGLDPESRSAFAKGLKKLSGFGTVFVVTHDSNMAAELADVRQLRVEKREGSSVLKSG